MSDAEIKIRGRKKPEAAPAAGAEGTDSGAAAPVAAAPSWAREGSELGALIAQAHKQYNTDNIVRPASQRARYRHIPTDVFMVDMALMGGVPEGLVTQVYGWESSGKTTLAMRAAAAAQAKHPDKAVVFVDCEGTFDPAWAERHSVDVEALLLVQPESGEQAVDLIVAAMGAADTAMVILDSIPALVPLQEQEKSAEDATVALHARLVQNLVRRVNQVVLNERKRGHWPALLLINQFRNKIQLMGDNRSLPGGNALKFFVAVSIEMKNKEVLGKDAFDVECVDHNEHSFVIKKNKVGNGIRNGEFVLVRNPTHPLGVGAIDEGRPVVAYAKKFELVSGGGSSWRLDGIDRRFGKLQEIVDFLVADPEQMRALKHRLISMQREHNGLMPDGWY